MKSGLLKYLTGGSFAGAAFLMATSAIGPGFITQTSVFTAAQGADFGFVILVSIAIDIIVQLNIWRIIAASGQKAPELANRVVPFSGHVLTLFIVLGGLVFNIGNIAGCGLGIQALAGLDPVPGAVISGTLAIVIFLVREFGRAMDRFAQWLGLLMIGMVLLVAWSSHPPVMTMAVHSILPDRINTLSILTLVGGTVGGYISFAGAHRMLETRRGEACTDQDVSRAAVAGIIISGIMRLLLFAAAFGVVAGGFTPDPANPAAAIFRSALGAPGLRIFGAILWCAAITSVVGASYTSVSFMETWHPVLEKNRRWIMVGFIGMATLFFALFGKPVQVLVAAGALNGWVLPLSLSLLLLAAARGKAGHQYSHAKWLGVAGWLVTALLVFISWQTFRELFS